MKKFFFSLLLLSISQSSFAGTKLVYDINAYVCPHDFVRLSKFTKHVEQELQTDSVSKSETAFLASKLDLVRPDNNAAVPVTVVVNVNHMYDSPNFPNKDFFGFHTYLVKSKILALSENGAADLQTTDLAALVEVKLNGQFLNQKDLKGKPTGVSLQVEIENFSVEAQ